MVRSLPRPIAARRRVPPRAPRYRAVALAALVLAGLAPASTAVAAPLATDGPAPTTPAITRDDSGVVEREPIRLGSSAGGGSGPAGAPVGVSADASVSLRPTAASAAVDVKDLWTETSRTERQRDGRFILTTAAGRMNYQDPAGEWHAIDLTLIPATSDRYGLRTSANDREVRFGVDDASAALAAITTSKGTLGLRALDYPSRRVDAPPEPTPSDDPAEPAPDLGPRAEPSPTATAATPEPGATATPAPALEEPSVEPAASAPAATSSPTASPVATSTPTEEPAPTDAPAPTHAPAPTDAPVEPRPRSPPTASSASRRTRRPAR